MEKVSVVTGGTLVPVPQIRSQVERFRRNVPLGHVVNRGAGEGKGKGVTQDFHCSSLNKVKGRGKSQGWVPKVPQKGSDGG